MSGDYSRFVHDARNRFTSVLNQQGRVQLDSDWNEAADIARERARTQALDTFGPVGVPFLTTPDGFEITAPVAGDFSIRQGRIYVDGLLAEIFPDESFTYQTQPFLPDPPAIGGANYAVYLDLWEREVTYIEDNKLIDKALGGVDTTTRIQQVWQVRTLASGANGGAAVCGTTVGMAPSGGRMSVAAIAPPAPEDPCLVPPLTGYRGLENRLYRVEIQQAGPLGTARFKWSRDNGSLVASIEEIAAAAGVSSIRVGRIGRDRTTRFAIGDFVTVTDDHRELNGEPGDMARIDDIDETNFTLKLDRTLGVVGRPFAVAPADLLARHTRVQKWDEPSSDPAVDGDGLILTAAGPIAIEDGIEVRFAQVGAEGFHVGDYWLFAARTADASVEGFVNAPPRGIAHVYAQLAAVNGGAVSDCRPPPTTQDGGCCTFVIQPGEDIQQAIDNLPPAGGCVCLKAGVHELREPLSITAHDVSLHGESTGAILHIAEGPLLAVSGFNHRVHELQFRRDRGGPAMITFVRARSCVLEDCALESSGRDGGIGISITESPQITIDRCTISGVEVGIELAGRRSRLAVITDCFITGTIAKEEEAGLPPGIAGILLRLGGDFGRIADCAIGGVANGIVCLDKEGDALALDRLAVTGNRIECRPARAQIGPRNMGIGVMVDDGLIADNDISMTGAREGAPVTGIAVGGLGLRIADNDLAMSVEDIAATSIGIHFGWNGEDGKLPTANGTVSGNSIDNFEVGIFAEDVGNSAIENNIATHRARERAPLSVGILAFRSRGGRQSDNRVTNMLLGLATVGGARNSVDRNTLERGLIGIAAAQETDLGCTGNTIRFYERTALFALDSRQRATIHDNHIASIGTTENEFPKSGIFLLGVTGQASVSRNEVVNIGFDVSQNPSPGVAFGIVVVLALEASVQQNICNYLGGWEGMVLKRGFDVEDRALLMQGRSLGGIIATDSITGYPALVEGNRFEGLGRTALVEFLEQSPNDPLLRFERTTIANNDCMHLVQRDSRAIATVVLKGRNAIVSANHFRSVTGRPRCVDFGQVGRPIFLGNYCLEFPTAAVAPAMLALNMRI